MRRVPNQASAQKARGLNAFNKLIYYLKIILFVMIACTHTQKKPPNKQKQTHTD